MLADVKALPGYEWVSNAGWAVDTDYTAVDGSGWTYAFDFHRLPVLLRSGTRSERGMRARDSLDSHLNARA